MKILGLIIIALLSLPQNVYSCDEAKEIVDCNKGSEFTWNPSNTNTSSKLNRFYDLDSLITQQYKLGNFVATKELITEYLVLADIYKNNWNYGNAVHDGNMVLGLLAISNGDINKGTEYLLKSGKSPGSPQLDSFGPDLDLANELLKLNKKDEVLTYLKDIRLFWDMDGGLLDKWIDEIDSGEKPELNRHAYNDMSWMVLIGWLSTLWPVLISIIFLASLKKKINKKLIFFISSIAAGYMTMLTLNWISTLLLSSIVSSTDIAANSSMFMLKAFAITGSIFILPVIVVFLVSRIFITKHKDQVDQGDGPLDRK